MRPYRRSVQYYETDMMGIAHHANAIHWMEEARIDFMAQLGFPYRRMEEEGVLSPVRSVSCRYKKPCTFGDTVEIAVSVTGFNGVVLTLGYEVTMDGALICEGTSEHVFVRKGGGLLRLKRDLPEFCAAIEGLLPPEPGGPAPRKAES